MGRQEEGERRTWPLTLEGSLVEDIGLCLIVIRGLVYGATMSDALMTIDGSLYTARTKSPGRIYTARMQRQGALTSSHAVDRWRAAVVRGRLSLFTHEQ